MNTINGMQVKTVTNTHIVFNGNKSTIYLPIKDIQKFIKGQ